jgi:tetratricopeptide (TPR) repeat protein
MDAHPHPIPAGRSIVVIFLTLCGLAFAPPRSLALEAPVDVPQALRSAAESKSRYADRDALELYEQVLRLQPGQPEALWNAAYLHLRLGWLNPDRAARQSHYETAYGYAARAYRRSPDSYDAHLVLGAAKAKLAEYRGNAEQVRTARELKEHAQFLLKRRVDNPDVWYLFAWWHFKVSRATVAERFFASLLFGGLPDGASTEAAFECLRTAIDLRPDYCAYRHDLGLFYERTGNLESAADMYRQAIGVPPRTPEDSIYIERARSRLMRLDSPPVRN